MRLSPPSGSFATPARRAGFIAAMHALADRPRSGPAVIYLSASQRRQTADWPRTLETIIASLPAGVWLDGFDDAFPGGPQQYRDHWRDYAADLDGLVAVGRLTADHTYLLGPGSRTELRSVIANGRPALLFTETCGLIPIVDCRTERIGDATRPSLRLTAPASWSPTAPTLHAALQALSPLPLAPSSGVAEQAGYPRE